MARLVRVAVVMVAMLSTALVAAPAQAGQHNIARWYALCHYVRSAMDDPIVHPGQPGASHMHDFFGNLTTDAYSTPKSLARQATSCALPQDHSGYWVPQMSFDHVSLAPTYVSTSWDPGGFDHVAAPPAGLEVVAGDADAPGPQSMQVVEWNCGSRPTGPGGTPERNRPYDCTPYQQIGAQGIAVHVSFPNCWDGIVTGGNDSAHLAYGTRGLDGSGQCPAGFDIPIAHLILRVQYSILDPLDQDGSIGLSLASGRWWTYHADFMSAWQQPKLQDLVDGCLNAQVLCGQLP